MWTGADVICCDIGRPPRTDLIGVSFSLSEDLPLFQAPYLCSRQSCPFWRQILAAALAEKPCQAAATAYSWFPAAYGVGLPPPTRQLAWLRTLASVGSRRSAPHWLLR